MNEAEWLACADPERMLRFMTEDDGFIGHAGIRMATERQLRLTSCACCRAVWSLLEDDVACPECSGNGRIKESKSGYEICKTCDGRRRINRLRRGVEVAEQFADYRASTEELVAAYEDVGSAMNRLSGMAWNVGRMVEIATRPRPNNLPWRELAVLNTASQADLMREVMGNPFRPDSSMLTPGPPVTCHICDGNGGEMVPTYGPPKRTHCCGVKMQERRDHGNERDGHWPNWCPRCWWTDLPEHTGYRIDKLCTCCKGKKTLPGRCPWLTPQVMSLAQAAYDERSEGRRCDGECEESYDRHGRKSYVVYRSNRERHVYCPRCHGEGTIDIMTLDPVRLAVLTDALLDAGCPEEVVEPCTVWVLVWGTSEGWHVGFIDNQTPEPVYTTKRMRDAMAWADKTYGIKDGTWNIYRSTRTAHGVEMRTVPNRLLAHLRSPGPHYRGCWALDLIRGKR